jgi:carbamoyltransferase
MKVKLNIDPSKSKLYLGIGSNHDFSGCLVKNGKIYKAVEAERINKLKHSLDAFNPFGSILKYFFSSKKANIATLASCDTLNPKYFYKFRDNIKLYNHHLCHAASVFYTSPFRESAIYVADGLGSVWEQDDGSYKYETYSYYLGSDNQIRTLSKQFGVIDDSLDETHLHQIYVPNSIGLFYNYITQIVGFNFLDDGKTMGLSAYGNPDIFYKEFLKHFKFKAHGVIDNDFAKEEVDYYSEIVKSCSDLKKQFKVKADIAASAQKVFEECYFYCLNHLYDETKNKNLCLSGGIILNSVANGKIKKRTHFENIHYFPGCGDDSIAVGSAFLAYMEDHKNESKKLINWQTPFLGKKYSEKNIEEKLKKYKVKFSRPNDIYKEIAKLLTQGKIVGWFKGESEFGPRALGHRSILADPRNAKMKDILNERVKHREFFRPFAPAVLEKYVKEYFEDIDASSPYMLEVFPVKKDKQSLIPSVVHNDGTGRLQTIGEKNIELYRVITEFFRLTGIPVILNTSFNINKMPIVETPEDAIKCFLNTEIDVLAIGNYICAKN